MTRIKFAVTFLFFPILLGASCHDYGVPPPLQCRANAENDYYNYVISDNVLANTNCPPTTTTWDVAYSGNGTIKVKNAYTYNPWQVFLNSWEQGSGVAITCDATYSTKADCENSTAYRNVFLTWGFIFSGDTAISNPKIWWIAAECGGTGSACTKNPNHYQTGVDTFDLTVKLGSSAYSDGEVRRFGALGWSRSFASTTSGSTVGPAYSNVTVTGTVPSSGSWNSGNYTLPLSYSWKFNGSTVCGSGTLSPDQNKTCTRQLGNDGTWSQWQFIVTDAEGDRVTSQHDAMAEWGGCSTCVDPVDTVTVGNIAGN